MTEYLTGAGGMVYSTPTSLCDTTPEYAGAILGLRSVLRHDGYMYYYSHRRRLLVINTVPCLLDACDSRREFKTAPDAPDTAAHGVTSPLLSHRAA